MAILGYRPILEVLSKCLYLPESRHLTLEEAIKEDFGERSIQRLEGYNIQLEAPKSNDFVLEFYRGDPIKGHFELEDGKRLTIGQTYQFPPSQLTGVSFCSNPLSSFSAGMHQEENGRYFRLWMNLNLPDHDNRFLQFWFYFPYSKLQK